MRIAIVGGIGSGKSEVLRVARSLGINALSADEINSDLLSSPEYIALIANAFPVAVKDGIIDKKTLADIVFSDDASLAKLNAIAHPQILKRIRENTSNPLVVEMPLLLESGAQDMFDEIVLVHTPILKRLKRLKGRGVSRADAIRRMIVQTSEQRLKRIATRVINNNGDIDALRDSAQAVFKAILAEKEV